jgi:hypothetical protein
MNEMNEDEYQRIVAAIGRKQLRTATFVERFGPNAGPEILATIDRLALTARLAVLARERPEDEALRERLASEMRTDDFRKALDAMRYSGALDALDDAPDPIFRHLTRSSIPDEDIEFLRKAAVEDPEAELALLVYWARNGLLHSRYPLYPSMIADEAEHAFYETASQLKRARASTSPKAEVGEISPAKKKRKLFNGLGKLLAGAITGAGNVLMLTGTIVAPNPATAYGVIASSAIAVTSLSAGIGDLRGE